MNVNTSTMISQDSLLASPEARPQKFTLFPELPLELRREIWERAILPRTAAFIHGKIINIAGSNISSLLRTSRESRKACIEFYTVQEDQQVRNSPPKWLCRSPEPDTLLIWNYKIGSEPLHTITKFGHLALSMKLWHALLENDYYAKEYQAIRTSPNLKSISIVLEKRRWEHGQRILQHRSFAWRPERRHIRLVECDEAQLLGGQRVKLKVWRERLKREKDSNPELSEPELRFVGIKFSPWISFQTVEERNVIMDDQGFGEEPIWQAGAFFIEET